jgi:uncharacterized protein YecE (DUF72 family)
MKKDADRLRGFLELLPAATTAAFEFRNKSWFDDDVLGLLREKGVALCIADSEKISAPVISTAKYGYFRLRDEGYDDAAIVGWRDKIAELSAGWEQAHVFFKHEEAGMGPVFAKRLLELAADAATLRPS